MIVISLILSSFSPLFRAIQEYFCTHFDTCVSFFGNRLIISHEILGSCSWYYSNGHYTKNSLFLSCASLLGAVLGYFLPIQTVPTRRQLTFTTTSPECPGLSITLTVIVLIRWSQHYSDRHYTNFFFTYSPFCQAPLHFVFVYASLFLKKVSISSDDMYLHRILGNSLYTKQKLCKNYVRSPSAWIFWVFQVHFGVCSSNIRILHMNF